MQPRGVGRELDPAARPQFAVVHGRFQPFHNEHLVYCLWALQHGESLVVGITNFDRAAAVQEATSSHRHTQEANPFAYWERALMIRDSLADAGVDPRRFSLVALPIHQIDRWAEYVPTDPQNCVHVLRVFSAWEEEKARRLREAGLRVYAAHLPLKRLSASEVRECMAAGGPWKDKVPPASARWIETFGGAERLRPLRQAP